MGVALAHWSLAVPRRAVTVRHLVSLELAGAHLVAISDSRLGVVRVFDRSMGGGVVVLDPVGGIIVDRGTRSVWNDEGRCMSGALRGSALSPADSIECSWFAWAAFYPDTEVYQ